MKRKESYQSGTVSRVPRKDGVDAWVFRYRRYDLHGKARKVAVAFSDLRECPTKAAAEKKAEPLRLKINEERVCVTFGELADKYKDNLPARGGTAATYRSNLKYLLERWSDCRLDWIGTHLMEVQLWVNTLKSRRDPAADLSHQTRQHVRNLLHKMFEDAMLWGYLTVQRNPIDLIEVKNDGRKKIKRVTVSLEEYDAILRDTVLEPHCRMMIHMAMYTGMRVSEILGLRWENIDFTKGQMLVEISATGKHLNPTKSDDSNENVPMHEGLAHLLTAWQKEQASVAGWVFGSVLTGRPFHRTSLHNDHLRPAALRLVSCPACSAASHMPCLGSQEHPLPEKNGKTQHVHDERRKAAGPLAKIGWHSFRHTYRSLLYELEEPLEVQQHLMRHAQITTTMLYGRESELRSRKLKQSNARVVAMFPKTAGGAQ